MTECHHWINGLVHHYSTTTVYGGKWVWYFWSLAHLCCFKALIFFSGIHFYTLSQTLEACRARQLRFFKAETLLNNAFNDSKYSYWVRWGNLIILYSTPLVPHLGLSALVTAPGFSNGGGGGGHEQNTAKLKKKVVLTSSWNELTSMKTNKI